MGKEASKPTL